MNRYTVPVYDMMMCMKEQNPGLNYFQGDTHTCGTGILMQLLVLILVCV